MHFQTSNLKLQIVLHKLSSANYATTTANALASYLKLQMFIVSCKQLRRTFSANCNLTKFNRRVLCQQEKRTRRKDNSSFAQHILFCRWLEQRYCVRFYACFTFYFNCGKIFQHIVIEPFKRQRQRIFLCKSLYVVKSLPTKKRLKTGVFVCCVKLHCNICKVE